MNYMVDLNNQEQAAGMPVVQDDPVTALSKPISDLLEQHVDQEVTPEKTRRFLMLRKAHNYNEGNQFNSLTVDTLTGGIDYSPIGTPYSPNMEQAEGLGLYDYNIDITKSYGRKYAAILGTRSWYNSTAIAKNPTSEKDRKAARVANILRDWFSSCWKLPTLNLEYFARQWDSGEVYFHLQWASDKRTFGTVDVPQYESKTVTLEDGGYLCPGCGVKSKEPSVVDALDPMGQPMQQTVCPSCGGELSDYHAQEPVTAEVPEYTGTLTFPQAGPKVTICTGMTVTVAQDTRDIRDTPYLVYEYEEHRGVLLEFFGEKLRSKMEDGTQNIKGGKSSANTNAVQARQTQYSSTGQVTPNLTNRWTYSRYWLRPAMYEYMKKEERERMKAEFPDGVKVSLVDGVVVDMVGEDLADVWVVGVPEPGKSIIHKPICWGILGHQDIINDFYQIMIANLERGLPTFLFDSEVVDREALARKSYLPTEAIPAQAQAGRSLENSVVKLPTASFPDQAPVIVSGVETNVQLHTGLLPSSWGGGEKSNTAEESRNRLQQALQQLSIHGIFAGAAYSDLYTLAVHMVAKNAAGDFNVSVGNGKTGLTTSETVDIQALSEGQFEFQSEVGVPMTFAERKDQLNQIITQNPDLASAMQLDSRSNLPIVRDALLTGMNELQVAGEDEWQATLEKIQQLLEEEPIMAPDGSQQSSQQPEEFVTNYATEADNVRQWLLSDQGRQVKREKPIGWRNVVLYGLVCSNLANPPMPPGAPAANPQQPDPKSPPPTQEQPGGTPPPDGAENPAPIPEQVGV